MLEGVTDDMVLCDEETFGPVVALYPVHSDEDAIRLANDTAYGLNAAVITRDKAVGRTIAQRLHAGTVNVNEAYGPSWGSTRSPMGGMGDSGLGRRHGDEGLLKYTESQTVATQRSSASVRSSAGATRSGPTPWRPSSGRRRSSA